MKARTWLNMRWSLLSSPSVLPPAWAHWQAASTRRSTPSAPPWPPRSPSLCHNTGGTAQLRIRNALAGEICRSGSSPECFRSKGHRQTSFRSGYRNRLILDASPKILILALVPEDQKAQELLEESD